MGKYAAIFAKSVKAELRYRSATLVSLLSSLLMFVLQIFLWRAVLGQGEVGGVRLPDMLLYVVITAFVGKLSSVNLSDKIEATIIDGTVSMEIIRPYSYKLYWFSTITGKNFYATMVALLPMLLISAFFVPASALPQAASARLFIPSVLLGVLITFELNYVFGLLAFWIQRCWFLGWYLSGFKSIFGGTVIPLWFYPDFLRAVRAFADVLRDRRRVLLALVPRPRAAHPLRRVRWHAHKAPASVVQMLFRDGFNMGYVSHFTISLVVLAYGLWASGWQPTLRGVLLLLSTVLGASLVQAAALIAPSTMAFFTVGDNPAMGIMYDIKDFTHYPITIFPRGIQFILTFILPFAFINFYPAAMLLGKEIPAGYPAALPYLTPLVGAVLFVLSLCLWNWGLKHYQSTGS